MNFDIVVVANKRRKPIITDYLKNVDHQVCYSDDPGLPANWTMNPTYKGLCVFMHQHVGQWNCLEVHKKAIEMSRTDNVLIIEDDARPKSNNWIQIAIDSEGLLNRFQIVSLHSREYNDVWNKERYMNKFNLFYPKDNTTPRRALGTLAYFVNKDTLPQIKSHHYNGLPIDIFYCNCFNFAFIEPTPFIHDRSKGSLIDKGVFK